MWKKIVIAGLVLQTGLMAADGEIDKTFGEQGTVVTQIDGNNGASSVAIQKDGKIVVCGTGWNENGKVDEFVTVRYKTDGELDDTFASGGKATATIGTHDKANSVAIQQDGKIVAGGSSNSTFSLLRYDIEGNLDRNFGTNGMVTTPELGGNLAEANNIILQDDGKILATGYRGDNDNHYDFATVRYMPNGSLDSNFGGNGIVITDLNVSDHCESYAMDLAVQKDGKIVVAGYVDDYSNSQMLFAVVRYDASGNLDAAFGEDGIATTPLGGFTTLVSSVAIQKDGKIVVGGMNDNEEGWYFVLVRYNEDGTLDNTFGTNGIIKIDNNIPAGVESIAIQSDGKIISAGGWSPDGGTNNFIVMRHNENGTLDNTFGAEGKAITTFDEGRSSIRDIAIQGDGKIVAAGSVNVVDSDDDFALARYSGQKMTPVMAPIYYLLQ